jgi:hypothetical protein
MPQQIVEYRCLLISPGDVAEERDALTRLMVDWNAQIGKGLGVRVELVRWESHAAPDMSGPPQDVINSQLVGDCDLGIAVFWSRLGTPTSTHPSGSVEEVYRLIQQGARVMVYFSERPIPQSALRDDQFAKLQEIRQRFQEQGLLATYSDADHLCRQVQLHLTNVVTTLLAKDRDVSALVPSSGTLTAPTPDVRVTVRGAVALHPITGKVVALSIGIQNHSPVSVFTGNIFIETRTGEQVMFKDDVITGEGQKPRELRPGESYEFYIDPAKLMRFSGLGLVCAAMRDAIGRVYRSTESELQNALRNVGYELPAGDEEAEGESPGRDSNESSQGPK